MKISLSSFIMIILVVAIILIVAITWFPLNNIPRFNGEFLGNADYIIRAEITAINGKPPQNKIADDFSLRDAIA